LLRLIRMEDESLAEFFGRYVSWALETYLTAKQSARSLLPLNPLATAPFAATDALARLVLGQTPWRNAQAVAPPPPPPEPEPNRPTSIEVAAAIDQEGTEIREGVAADVARLRAEIEALRLSMRRPARRAKRRKK